MKKGLYIHIPFCLQKCKYCDFVSFVCNDYDEYINALCRELESYKGEAIDTVFVGGGTPTILPLNLTEKLFSHINKTFRVDSDAEWSVEANPKTVDREKLHLMRSLGVNRLSVGVQSFTDSELERIGRVNSSNEALETLSLVAEYFDNYNIDIISALPNQTLHSFTNTINKALSCKPTHISCYSLILEEGTPLYTEHMTAPLMLPDEDLEREMYLSACNLLEQSGYNQYEISNFAKPGFECKHNLKYWHCDDYIGAGVAAHSLIDGVRIENTSVMSDYIKGNIISERNTLSKEDMIAEYIIMSLRLREGIDKAKFSEKFSQDFSVKYREEINRFINLGLMEETKTGYRLTKDGISVSNSVLCEFV